MGKKAYPTRRRKAVGRAILIVRRGAWWKTTYRPESLQTAWARFTADFASEHVRDAGILFSRMLIILTSTACVRGHSYVCIVANYEQCNYSIEAKHFWKSPSPLSRAYP